MPVGPRYPLGDSQSRVPRQFTDRRQFIEAFEEAISELPLKEYRVLVYYGVGGIGKTSLRKELARLLDEQHPQTVWAVLDFRTPTHRDVETALFWLRQELNRKHEVQLPLF